MGEPARKLGTGQMLFPGRYRSLRGAHDRRRLMLLLGEGVLWMQPWPVGRRAVYLPDRAGRSAPNGLYSPTGTPIRKGLHVKQGMIGSWPLDVMLRSGGFGGITCLDVMVPEPLEKRRAIAEALGHNMQLQRAQSADDVAMMLEGCEELGHEGVLIKDGRVPYPWLPFGQRYVRNWWLLKREDFR